MDCDEALSMWSVRACRICLALGVKFHTIGPLHSCYQALVALTDVRRPVLVCYECVAYLRRFRQLRDKSQRTQTLLTSILQDEHEITQETVESINRDKNHLRSQIKVRDIEYWEVDYSVTLECVLKNETALKKERDAELNADEDSTNSGWKRDSTGGEDCVWMDGGSESKRDSTTEIEDGIAKAEPISYTTEVFVVPCDFDDDSDARNQKSSGRRKSQRKPSARKIFNVKTERKKKVEKPKKKLPPRKRKAPKERKSIRYAEAARNGVFSKFIDILPVTQEEAMNEILKRKDGNNYKASSLKCEICFKGFWEKPAYENHMITHDPKSGAFECDICHCRVRSRHKLTKHIGQCHKWKFCCKKCPYVTCKGNQAKKHEEWHNGKQYSCKDCDKTFSFYSTMMNHKRKVHAKEFSCRLCGLCFVGEYGVAVHTNKVHGGSQNKAKGGHKCADCDIDFASSEALKRHLVVSGKHNLKQTANGCDKCGEIFPTKQAYKEHHRKLHARKIPSEQMRCHVSHGLAPEAFVPMPRRKFETEKVCNPGQHSHMCDVCGKKFLTCFTLKHHLHMHTGYYAYKCHLCTKAFRAKLSLDQHILTHNGEKPYICEVCGTAFNKNENLARHVKDVHATMPVRCDVCGKVVKNDTTLKAHIKHVHLKVPYPIRRGRK